MKRSYISHIVRASVVAPGLPVVLLNLPTQAQTNAAPDTSNTTPGQDVARSRGDRDFDGVS